MRITVKIELTDNRDGSTYARVYIDTPDWSESVRDLVAIVLPECYPDFGDRRSKVSPDDTSGILRDYDGTVVGTYTVTDAPTPSLRATNYGRPAASYPTNERKLAARAWFNRED